MQIFVRTVANCTLTLDVAHHFTDDDVKALVQQKKLFRHGDYWLSFAGQSLDGGRTLSFYGIQQGSTIDLTVPLRGGHCQVPCGIFDDPKLVVELRETCATIRKAMVHVGEMSNDLSPSGLNQLIRWTETKEKHASKIVTFVSEYCLCQRLKPVGDPKTPFKSQGDYIEALRAHHTLLLAAVACKQTVDLSNVDRLEAAIGAVSSMYVKQGSAIEDSTTPTAVCETCRVL
eukprot:TRINITY_DN68908_c0_g1_i1.p1 TRINITY_DN68908_c0_g1~~TRINITY_DN68908_c0_g1_i1.p1  ORF type:complete len:230 (-),score=36.43 TRINITY_DN68908_c0_g1_i1:180-869(-)